MGKVDSSWILSFSRELRRIDDYGALVELVRRFLHEHFGLTNAWLYVFEREEDEHAVLVAAAGTKAAEIAKELPVAPIEGDWLTAALRRDEGPIVIADAPLIEGNPDVARRLGNRTVVNMPIGVVDKALGIVGGGTFGDEGPVPIDETALAQFVQLANITSVAVARLVLRSRDAMRAELQARLAHRQRLESLGLLAGGVAHDFNNLLTVIRGNVSFIAAEPLTETQKSNLDTIANAVGSAAQLTKKLLLLGRQLPPQFQRADINVVIQDFLQLLERVIPANIQTDFVPGARLPMVRIDPHQLEQVMMNLALNARDAMPSGGRITFETQHVLINGDYVRAHPWAKTGRYVLLSISDTGTGMPREVMERVFEPFFTTKPPGEGTGLGLAIVWGIVQAHGGMVNCSSEMGVGTCFDVYLPVGGPALPEEGIAGPGVTPGGNEHILVADDEPQVRALLARVLTEAGYSVVGVGNGAAAVRAASKESFDLHILDAVMPVLGGRQAYDLIRAARPTARFLIISGYGGQQLPPRFLAAAHIEVISKPFDPNTLLFAVRASLDKGK